MDKDQVQQLEQTSSDLQGNACLPDPSKVWLLWSFCSHLPLIVIWDLDL